ncbi:MAG: hypothetical protein BWX73_00930 [Lentisphaerae bacterium ADurb.Bin082]|nr:MAG: hypothetical protein BWX73_00930 [Lentisphaerae bacterium ADurb.Bin082]
MLLLFQIELATLILSGFMVLVGACLRKCLGIASFRCIGENLFYNALSGAFAIASGMALICTGSRGSIMLCITIPACLFLILQMRCEQNDEALGKCLSLGQLFVLLAFLMGYAAGFYVCVCKEGIIIPRSGDFRDWSVLVTCLQDGFENRAGFTNILSQTPPEPYHWIELWLAVPVVWLLKIPFQLACDCVVYSVLVNLFVWGLIAYDLHGEKSIFRTLFACILPHLAVIGIYVICRSSILHLPPTHSGRDFWYRWILSKDVIPLCLLLSAFMQLRKKRMLMAATSLLCVISTDVSWWPSLLMASGGTFIALSNNNSKDQPKVDSNGMRFDWNAGMLVLGGDLLFQ